MSLHILKKRYEVVRRLAKKAGRMTLLAKDVTTNQLVVVKLLIFNSEFKWEELKLFEREAKTLLHLSYSAIPSYIDFFELTLQKKKALAFVQTYIEAPSLEEYMEKIGNFSEIEVKQIAESVLKILIYLHGQKPSIIHRDIKPSNILLTNRSGNSIGEVFLVDFGSVQTIANSESGIFTVVGTYGYMAPEQFGGRAVAASDLYGLGATLINLLTGKSPADFPQKEGRIQFEAAANCSREFKEWLKRMVEPVQEKRFKSADFSLKSLENLSSLSSMTFSQFSYPFINKIYINKSVETIEIETPCQKHKKDSIAHFIIAANIGFLYGLLSKPLLSTLETIIQSLLINYGLTHIYSLAAICILPLIILIYAIIWVKIIENIFFIPFGKHQLKIDDKRIYFAYKLFGLEYRYRRSMPRQAIIKLDTNTNSKNKIPEIIIWVGVYKYSFGKHFLTSKEARLLSRKISNWLGL